MNNPKHVPQTPTKSSPKTFVFQIIKPSEDKPFNYEAAEEGSGHRFPVGTTHEDASYPDIAQHLRDEHDIDVDLTYNEDLGDEHDNSSDTWTFKRPEATVVVIVKDIPRTGAVISRSTAT